MKMQYLECIIIKNFIIIPTVQAYFDKHMLNCRQTDVEISTDAIASVLMLSYLDLFFALYVLVNALRAGFACAHCEDNGCGAGDSVASCKHALTGGSAALVGLDAALTCKGKTLCGVADQGIGAGADCDNNGVNIENPVRALNGNRLAATLFIGLAELLLLKLDAGDVTVLACMDGDGVVEQPELNALGLCMLDLFLTGGQLSHAAAVDDVDILGTQALGAAGGVHGDVAAADDCAAFADLGLVAEVYLAQEVNAAVHALELLAGYAELCRLLSADSDKEALIALLAQLVDGDILADLDAALELYAHFLENVDLGVNDLTLKAEGGDAESQHAAGYRITVKNGDIRVAHLGQVVSAAHAGRTRSDDGNLLDIVCIGSLVTALFGDVAGLFAQLLLGDELLDLVDSDGAVELAAGAGVLAAAIADAAADRRERVILLDELESVKVSALACHLDVALNGDVRRAGCLTGSGAALVAVFLVVVFIVHIPHVLTPVVIIGQRLLGIYNRAVFSAELLAELCGACRTYLNALAAGNALFLIDVRTVCGSGHVGSIEKLRGAQMANILSSPSMLVI